MLCLYFYQTVLAVLDVSCRTSSPANLLVFNVITVMTVLQVENDERFVVKFKLFKSDSNNLNFKTRKVVPNVSVVDRRYTLVLAVCCLSVCVCH